MRGRGPSFREVLNVPEYRALWLAELLSILGDQLARVALAVLVYRQTSSAALTALTYALTFVPAVLGGVLLAGLADRFPRRRVLVSTDLLRTALAGLLAVPAMPLPALWVLVALLSMAAGPFKAAQLALLPQVLVGERYLVGLSLRQMTVQTAQLIGFASGGLVLAVVEPHVALALNAATFAASAVVIVLGVRSRPAAVSAARQAATSGSTTNYRLLLPVVAVVALAGLFVVPEGIAAPYGTAVGVGTIGIGLLMAADPVGSVIGAWLISRIRIPPTTRSVVLLAVGAGLPLILCAAEPGLALSMALWAVNGALSTAYLIQTQAIVVELVPDHQRGRVMGRIATCLSASQGLAIVAGGVAAEVTGPFRAVAGAGLLGIVLVLCVGVWWRRVARPRHDVITGSEHGPARRNAASQYSLLRIEGTSLRARCATKRKADGQYSLFRMKGTSSGLGGIERKADGQYSLFRTKDTSSWAARTGDGKAAGQYSLLRIKGTSLRARGGTERKAARQYSLFRMKDTSSTAARAGDVKDPDQYSRLRTENTSSPTDRRAGHVARAVAKSLTPLNRRLGTRAPSLWRWSLSAVGARLTPGMVIAR